MATLKATLNLSTTTLFPNPVNFTEIANETIGGSYGGFTTNSIASGATNVSLWTGTAPGSGVLYAYFKSASANTVNIDIEINDGVNTMPVLRLTPGDIAFLPIDASSAITVQADNGAAASVLYYFFGEKG